MSAGHVAAKQLPVGVPVPLHEQPGVTVHEAMSAGHVGFALHVAPSHVHPIAVEHEAISAGQAGVGMPEQPPVPTAGVPVPPHEQPGVPVHAVMSAGHVGG